MNYYAESNIKAKWSNMQFGKFCRTGVVVRARISCPRDTRFESQCLPFLFSYRKCFIFCFRAWKQWRKALALFGAAHIGAGMHRRAAIVNIGAKKAGDTRDWDLHVGRAIVTAVHLVHKAINAFARSVHTLASTLRGFPRNICGPESQRQQIIFSTRALKWRRTYQDVSFGQRSPLLSRMHAFD